MPDFGAFNHAAYPRSRVSTIPDSIFSQDYQTLLRLLRNARRKAGVTQNEVAEQLGLVRSIIGKIERGERRIDVIELRDFCAAIGVPLILFIHQLETELEQAKPQNPTRRLKKG